VFLQLQALLSSSSEILDLSMGSMHGGISGEGLRMLDNFRRS